MRILFVLENYYPHIGGVETLFKSLAVKLSEQNHEVVVLTTLKSDIDLPFETNGKVTVHRKKYFNRYFFTIFAFFAAFKLAKKCDLIHTTSYNAALPAWLAGKLRNKKVIITFHEVWGKLWFRLPYMSSIGARLHYMFEQMLLKLSFHRFVAVSKFTRDALIQQGVDASRVDMIYNGIDYEDFERVKHTDPSQDFVFTFFGRLGMSKGIDLLLEAIKILAESNTKAIYQMIIPTAPKPFLNQILAMMDELKIRDKIALQHNLAFKDLQKVIANSSAVVIPSYSEGFCFAAVETMAIGTPIISSGQGALAEVVSGKYLQMESFDAKGLASAMQQAIHGNWSETTSKRFDLSQTVDNYISLYQSTASEK